jgi:hypothetical protein
MKLISQSGAWSIQVSQLQWCAGQPREILSHGMHPATIWKVGAPLASEKIFVGGFFANWTVTQPTLRPALLCQPSGYSGFDENLSNSCLTWPPPPGSRRQRLAHSSRSNRSTCFAEATGVTSDSCRTWKSCRRSVRHDDCARLLDAVASFSFFLSRRWKSSTAAWRELWPEQGAYLRRPCYAPFARPDDASAEPIEGNGLQMAWNVTVSEGADAGARGRPLARRYP